MHQILKGNLAWALSILYLDKTLDKTGTTSLNDLLHKALSNRPILI